MVSYSHESKQAKTKAVTNQHNNQVSSYNDDAEVRRRGERKRRCVVKKRSIVTGERRDN